MKTGCRLNARQRLFCEHYASGCSAAEAYRRAGYSPKGADQSAEKLLRFTEIKALVKKLQDEAGEAQVDYRREVLVTNRDIMLDRKMRPADRIRASEVIAKVKGLFAPQTMEVKGDPLTELMKVIRSRGTAS